MKECAYRRCKNTIEGNKIYCCKNCRSAESVYRSRDKKVAGVKGRPKHKHKSINDLTDDDLKLLEIFFKKR